MIFLVTPSFRSARHRPGQARTRGRWSVASRWRARRRDYRTTSPDALFRAPCPASASGHNRGGARPRDWPMRQGRAAIREPARGVPVCPHAARDPRRLTTVSQSYPPGRPSSSSNVSPYPVSAASQRSTAIARSSTWRSEKRPAAPAGTGAKPLAMQRNSGRSSRSPGPNTAGGLSTVQRIVAGRRFDRAFAAPLAAGVMRTAPACARPARTATGSAVLARLLRRPRATRPAPSALTRSKSACRAPRTVPAQ